MQFATSQKPPVRFVFRTFAEGLAPILEIQAHITNTLLFDFDESYRFQLNVLLQSIDHVKTTLFPVRCLENADPERTSEEGLQLQEILGSSLLNLLIHKTEFLLTVEERVVNSLEEHCPLNRKSQFNVLANGIISIREQLESMLVLAYRNPQELDLAANEFDLCSTLSYAFECMKTLAAHKKKLLFKFEWHSEQFNYRGTRSYVLQIVSLLLANAVKFTESGLITLAITRDSAYVRCHVIDTGLGLTEEELGKMLSSSDLPKRMIIGRGPVIGLAHASQLAKIIGGEITATSEKFKGSNFCLSIPLN
jgi:two-component system, sensor histidine kinase and response regulator